MLSGPSYRGANRGTWGFCDLSLDTEEVNGEAGVEQDACASEPMVLGPPLGQLVVSWLLPNLLSQVSPSLN